MNAAFPSNKPAGSDLPRLRIFLSRWIETAFGNRFDLVTRMTLLLLLLYSIDLWYVKLPVTLLCVLAFLIQTLRRSPLVWFCFSVLLAFGIYRDWYSVDNHKYLMLYWCMVLFFSLRTDNPDTSASTVSRPLIGLVFLLAVFWKLTSPDFLDGTFFHYSLLTDPRFTGLAELIGGLPPQAEEFNQAARTALVNYDSTLQFVQLRSGPGVHLLAGFLTWWSLLLEALVAAAFLSPRRWLLSKWRDPALLAFVVSTYFIAPVMGFGWVLIILGLAQSDEKPFWVPAAYLAAFPLLLAYRLL